MNRSKMVELVVGLFVCLGLAALLIFTLQVSSGQIISEEESFTVYAEFENIGSLKLRAPVAIAGVTVGRVAGIEWNPASFEAKVSLRILKEYDMLPKDSSASILTAGLLGEQYVGITPGGAMKSLKQGDKIKFTQSAVILEQMISQLMFKMAAGDDKDE